jgi:hypothetical protein
MNFLRAGRNGIAGFLLIGLFCPAAAQEDLSFIEGEWNNDSGYNIRIEPDRFGGWNIWLKDGIGTIGLDGTEGGNIKVASETMTCFYRVTPLADGRMNWQLKLGPQICLRGYFNPVRNTADYARLAHPAVMKSISGILGNDLFVGGKARDVFKYDTRPDRWSSSIRECLGQTLAAVQYSETKVDGMALLLKASILPDDTICKVSYFQTKDTDCGTPESCKSAMCPRLLQGTAERIFNFFGTKIEETRRVISSNFTIVTRSITVDRLKISSEIAHHILLNPLWGHQGDPQGNTLQCKYDLNFEVAPQGPNR